MHTWGPHHRSSTIKQAAELLGTLLLLCRVCKWGIFLVTNLLKAVHEMLDENSKQLMHLDEFRLLMQEASCHPTDSSQYQFFASKVARQIWDEKALTCINQQIHEELDFIKKVFADPSTYK